MAMSVWRECKLKDVVRSANTGLDAIKRAPIVEYNTGIKCLRIQDISQNKKFDDWGFSIVDEKNYDKFLIKKGDIFIARTGASIGVNLLINNDMHSVFNNGLIRLKINENIADYKYVYYTLCSYEYRGHIENISGGTSTQPNMQVNVLLDYDIYLPPLLEQRAIAEVLSGLDDKIDLLHRQNKTLEAMAETLFRQWFVEEAKDDWEMGTILDFASYHKISIQPQQNPLMEFFHYSIPAFDNNKNSIKEFGESIQSNKFTVPQYCILFSKLNPHKDKRIWLLLDDAKRNSICSTEFQIVLPKKKEYLYFLYGWLSLKENYDEIALGVGGTSGSHQRIDPSTIFNFQCPLIREDILFKYNNFSEPIFKKVKTNQSQIRTLEKLRDTLLPKLMSGEVRVEV